MACLNNLTARELKCIRARTRWGTAALADREMSQVVGVGGAYLIKVGKFTLES